MELKPSTDFGARDFDGKGGREIHDHLSSVPTRAWPPSWAINETADGTPGSCKDKKVRVDIFGLRDGGRDRRQAAGPAPSRGPRL